VPLPLWKSKTIWAPGVLFIHGGSGVNTTTFAAFANRAGLITDDTLGLGVGIAARQAGGDIRFYTGGIASDNERMIIDSVGRVGIGTTNPGSRLHLSGGGGAWITDTNNGLWINARQTTTPQAVSGLDVWAQNDLGTATYVNGIATDVRASNNITGNINAISNYLELKTGTTISGGAYGINNAITIYNTTAANVYGASTGIVFSNTDATITNLYGHRIYIDPSTTANVTNRYGLHLNNIAGATTGNFSIYSEGGTMYHAGNIGIGTTNPLSQLHLSQSSTSGISLEGTGQDGRRWGLSTIAGSVIGQYTPGAFYITDHTASLVRLTIKPVSGNIGIGTIVPDYKLDVSDSASGTLTLNRLQNTVSAAVNSGSRLMFAANRTSGDLTDVAGVSGIITDIGSSTYKGSLIFETGDNAAPAERMRLNHLGYVGIGTTNPAAKFSLTTRSIGTTQNDAHGIMLSNTTGATSGNPQYSPGISFHGTAWNADLSQSTSINFRTYLQTHGSDINSSSLVFESGYNGAYAPRMTIQYEGNVGIGTTSPGTHKLSVVGTAGLTTGTAWTNTSDVRLKNIDSQLTGSSLDKIMALNPVSYRWNSLHAQLYGSTTEKLNFGFIAQEVEHILPSLITTDAQGYKWYNPSGFEALLTAAIQEQQLQISTLNFVLNGEGNLLGINIESTTDGSYLVKNTITNTLIESVIALKEAVIARLQVGYLTAREAEFDKLTVKNKSIAELVADEVNSAIAGANQPVTTTITADTTQLEQQVAQLEENLETLETELTTENTLQNEIISTHSSRLDVLTTRNSQLENAAATLSARISYLENRVTGETDPGDITPLTSAKPISPEPVTPVESRLGYLESLIASLSASLSPEPVEEATESPEVSDLTLSLDATISALIDTLEDSGSIPSTTVATDLNLTVDMINTQALFVADFLSVMGDAVLTNITVTNQLTTNTITSLDGKLTFMAGLMTLDAAGNVTINGDLTVSGQITARTAQLENLSVSSLQAPEIDQLAAQSADLLSRNLELETFTASLAAQLTDLEARLATMSAAPAPTQPAETSPPPPESEPELQAESTATPTYSNRLRLLSQ
jgi:hypothetical protein